MSIVNSLLKVFLGDKSGKDLKKITPLVDDINNHFIKMSSLSNDQLRNKTIEFKKSISNQTSDINQSIGELNIKISDESSNTEKELLFKEVESLENDLILKKAEILDELLPEAFAVIKETAKRFFENEEIEVTTSDLIKKLRLKSPIQRLKMINVYGRIIGMLLVKMLFGI